MNLSRINIEIRAFGHVLYTMIARIQTTAGITSKIEENTHIILWDLDNMPLEEAVDTLQRTQTKYNLSDIHILSDKENSYRAICFTQVTFHELLKILVNTDGVDDGFLEYTVRRRSACIRLAGKIDRSPQETVMTLKTYTVPLPEKIQIKVYETSASKKEVNIVIG